MHAATADASTGRGAQLSSREPGSRSVLPKRAGRRPGEMTMLSIGKLAAGQAKYYLDQAQVRVDVVQSVGGGVEDYYVAPGEARGRWLGAAARELELNGDVGPEQLRRVLEGLDPRDGSELRTA